MAESLEMRGLLAAWRASEGRVALDEVYAAQLADRHARGVYYTPVPVVDRLVAATLGPLTADARSVDEVLRLRIVDPTCGTGRFLLGAARWLMARATAVGGTTTNAEWAARIVSECLHGVDLDAVALEITAFELGRWAAGHGAVGVEPRGLRRGDALLGATPEAIAAGVPDAAFTADRPEQRAGLGGWRRRNRALRASPAPSGGPSLFGLAGPSRSGLADPGAPAARAYDAWCAAFLLPGGAPEGWEDVILPWAYGLPAFGVGGRVDAPRGGPGARAAGPPGREDAAGAALQTLRDRDGLLHWALSFPGVAFDAVLGNPPFLNQLERETTFGPGAGRLVRALLPGLVGAYTDVSAMVLARAFRLLRPGGRLGLVQPASFLGAADAAAVRALVTGEGTLTGLWWAGGPVFPGTNVRVCAVIAERAAAGSGAVPGAGEPRVERWVGPTVEPVTPLVGEAVREALSGATWTPLVAELTGLPPLGALPSAGTLADLATATADFRDEYYGLIPHVVEGPPADDGAPPRLVLTGHIDAAGTGWGTGTVRFARRAWTSPRVDVAGLPPKLQRWAASRLRPKLLVATQTRTIEAVADPEGRWLTTTPTVSVFPVDGALWRVAAVLLSPVAALWALHHHGGKALTGDTIKLAARELLDVPLPPPGPAWEAAAELVRRAHADATARRVLLLEAGGAMIEAYGADPALLGWWERRF